MRLLLDINGFRARQRKQLISIVQTTVEQVLRTREEHEFQPMTLAERKVVHDAVAAIDGVSTESLGEEPNRRVIIRPAYVSRETLAARRRTARPSAAVW